MLIPFVGNKLFIIHHIATDKIMFAGGIIIMAIEVSKPYYIAKFMVEGTKYLLKWLKVLVRIRCFEC